MTQQQQPTVRAVIRLSDEAMKDLEASLPPPMVSSSTTPIDAGFRLGIQLVLDKLRKGFTTGG